MPKLKDEEVEKRLEKIKNLCRALRIVHYSRVALELKCSPSVAISWCKMAANLYPKELEYLDGWLRVKEE